MPAWYDPTVILKLDSGEHAFQCAQRRNKTEHERIRHADSPLAAKRAAWEYSCPPDWNRRRAHVMLTVVRAKFAVPELREPLLSTGDRILAENSPRDFVWGCRDRAGGYTGQNLLGRALMRVRDEARVRRSATRPGASRAVADRPKRDTPQALALPTARCQTDS
jgi:ribA/ribD-fused uncharacterized protein